MRTGRSAAISLFGVQMMAGFGHQRRFLCSRRMHWTVPTFLGRRAMVFSVWEAWLAAKMRIDSDGWIFSDTFSDARTNRETTISTPRTLFAWENTLRWDAFWHHTALLVIVCSYIPYFVISSRRCAYALWRDGGLAWFLKEWENTIEVDQTEQLHSA
jgi:hypothetical protein